MVSFLPGTSMIPVNHGHFQPFALDLLMSEVKVPAVVFPGLEQCDQSTLVTRH